MALAFFNSKDVEWSDQKVYIEGVDGSVKLEGVKFGVEVDKEHLFAGGDEPLSIQSGNRKYTGSMTFLKGSFDALNFMAIEAGGRDITDVSFSVVVTYKAQGTRGLSYYTLSGVEVSKFELGMMQGDKSMKVELPFLFLQLIPEQ